MLSRPVKRSLLQTMLLLAPVAPALLAATAAPAAAQGRRVAPHHTVMGVRLVGTWEDSKHRYYFRRREDGTVEFVQARKINDSWVTMARGVLQHAPIQGAMIGEVTYFDTIRYTKEVKAWISDDHRLWMDGRNADSEGFFKRVSTTTTPPDVSKAWVGRWRTSQGMLEIEADNGNLFGWLTRDGDKRKERVAIRADAKTGKAGWDSEYDEHGNWLHKPVRWGDMTLFMSGDGKSFTGIFSSTRPDSVGLFEQSWTGERVEAEPGRGDASTPVVQSEPPSVDLIRLGGVWTSPLGRIEIHGSGQAGGMAGNLMQPDRDMIHFEVQSSKGELIGRGLKDRDGERTLSLRRIDDRSLEFRITAGAALRDRTTFVATLDQPAGQGTLAGEWQTSLGKLSLRTEGSHLLGTIVPDQGGSEGRMIIALHRFDEHSRWIPGLAGAWKAEVVGVEGAGTMRFDPADDGKSFTATYTRKIAGKLVEQGWSGRRIVEESQPVPTPRSTPAPAPSTPAPSSPVPPAPGPSTPVPAPGWSEAPADGFQPLGKWDVRLDRVENPRDDRLTHVYLTLRNPVSGTRDLLQTQDVWVYLEAGGIEQKSGQGLRAEPGYPKLFGSPPPVVRPGKEIRTKFVFDRQSGGGAMTITIEEGGQQAVYDF